jgi:hypothetical protein
LILADDLMEYEINAMDVDEIDIQEIQDEDKGAPLEIESIDVFSITNIESKTEKEEDAKTQMPVTSQKPKEQYMHRRGGYN